MSSRCGISGRNTILPDLIPISFFTCLHFETYLRTGDSRFISTFTDEAAQWKFSVRRDQDGAVCYHINPESKRIFIDMLQGYAVFMARAGYLSKDEKQLVYQLFVLPFNNFPLTYELAIRNFVCSG